VAGDIYYVAQLYNDSGGHLMENYYVGSTYPVYPVPTKLIYPYNLNPAGDHVVLPATYNPVATDATDDALAYAALAP
jgi:hypothetical protein